MAFVLLSFVHISRDLLQEIEVVLGDAADVTNEIDHNGIKRSSILSRG